MSFMKCPECRKDISEQATSCPSCGLPLGKKKCLYCGFINFQYFQNCQSCGAVLPLKPNVREYKRPVIIRPKGVSSLVECPQCHFQIPMGYAKCINCGTQIYEPCDEKELRRKGFKIKFIKSAKRIIIMLIIAVILTGLFCYFYPVIDSQLLPKLREFIPSIKHIKAA